MQKVTKRNIALAIIFLLILVVVALLIGNFTYSFLGADIDEDVTTKGETTASGDTLIFSSGNTLSLHATTDNFNATSGNLTDTTNPSVRLIASSRTNNATATYFAGIRIYENTYTYSSGTTAEVILTVRDENGALLEASSDELPYVTVNGVSGFDITGKTGAFNIAIDHPISTTSSTNGTTHTWTFTLTFVNLETDQSINENANLEMDVVLQQDRIAMPNLSTVCPDGGILASCVQDLYNTYGEGYDGLYLHDGVGSYTNADQEAGDNSYRYAGANPNNYVCFGSDEETCPAENLYRIIGVFDDDKDSNYQIKLIKADYVTSDMLGTDGRDYYGAYPYGTSTYKGNMDTSTIAAYRWNYDTSVSEFGSNNWTTSEFNKINLNTNYWNYLGATWQNLIAKATWHLGGMISMSNTAKAFYDGERNNDGSGSNPTTYSDEIGLMYPSDYGYAASPEAWITDLSGYNNSTITANNWMYMELVEWTIIPDSSSDGSVFNVNSSGNLYSSYANSGYAARPVFYLESGVTYVSGNGTKGNPFRIDYEVPLADHIKGLYDASNEGANGIYYHDGVGTYGTLEAGDNSYRFSGANPNNYVCFGTDEETCPADNLYRIIGVFGNQVKLIKHDYATTSLLGTAPASNGTPSSSYYKGSLSSIPYYYWSGSSSNDSNTWSSSTLNTSILNGTYLNTLGSEWTSKIATTSWKVGGMSWSRTNTAKQYYTTELGSSSSSTTYNAKIGLMYVSEYGYSASPENWNTALYNYGNDTNRNNNWMFMGAYDWTISRSSDDSDVAFDVNGDGVVYSRHVVYYYRGVRPSFSLESSVVLSGGSGSSADPYRIA